MTIERVLIADDEPLMRHFAADTLKRLGFDVVLAQHGQEAIARLREESFDLVLTDCKMPLKDGFDVLKAAKALHPSCSVILMTAFGTIESAVDAIRLGASNYLIKPFPPEALEAAVEQCETQTRTLLENHYLRESAPKPCLVAESPAMKRVVQDLEKIAKSHASVFLVGESGTGKEVIAAEIHRLSLRANHPFVKVNCAAIAETLLESEFFGHEKGAFTGAHVKKIGRFELAHQGTLLLDEVTEIPLALQPKLLRAIQEQEFERVGGTRSINVNVRLLATSNRNMQEAIETKLFREDLFYRLNVIPLKLPPLRERIEDILPLANHFLDLYCKENHKPRKALSKKSEQFLMAYSWPGNVRELANVVERTVVLDFEEDCFDIQEQQERRVEPVSFVGKTLHEVEKRLILDTLEAHGQNRTKTATLLGISVRTLRNKLHEYTETT